MKTSRIFSFIALLLVGILLAACGANRTSAQPSAEVSLQTASSADISSVAETAASPSSAEQPSSTKQPTSEEAVVTTVPSEETTTPDDAVESVFLWEKNDTGITITRYTGRDPRPVVPAVIDGLPVTVLKASFESKEGLETVTLPASLQSVKLGWIKNNSLKAVYFEGTLGDWCRIDFQDGGVRRNWDSTLKLYIGGEAVKDVTIPEGTTVVNNYLFAGCETLERVVLPDSVTEIDYAAFSGFALERYFREKFIESAKWTRIGSWWDRKGENEIDLVCDDEVSNRLDLFEVKRDRKRIDLDLLRKKSIAFFDKNPKMRDREVSFGGLSIVDM